MRVFGAHKRYARIAKFHLIKYIFLYPYILTRRMKLWRAPTTFAATCSTLLLLLLTPCISMRRMKRLRAQITFAVTCGTLLILFFGCRKLLMRTFVQDRCLQLQAAYKIFYCVTWKFYSYWRYHSWEVLKY